MPTAVDPIRLSAASGAATPRSLVLSKSRKRGRKSDTKSAPKILQRVSARVNRLILGLAPGFGNHEDIAKKQQSKKRGAGVAGIAWYREASLQGCRFRLQITGSRGLC
jgi:hypothetical protein